MAAEIQAVEQASCENCESTEENYSVESRVFAETGIFRHLRCDCGAEGIVRVFDEGLSVGGPISHEDASWNQETED